MAGRAPAVARATLKAISTDQLGTAKHSLFGVLGQLQNSGVGQKVSRSIWTKWGDSCYWTVQRVEMTGDNSGKAWGTFTFRGETNPTVQKIRSPKKKQWRLIEGNESEAAGPQ